MSPSTAFLPKAVEDVAAEQRLRTALCDFLHRNGDGLDDSAAVFSSFSSFSASSSSSSSSPDGDVKAAVESGEWVDRRAKREDVKIEVEKQKEKEEDAEEEEEEMPSEVRVPRILFFGGDAVSLTALEALYERLECIARRAFALQEGHNNIDDIDDIDDDDWAGAEPSASASFVSHAETRGSGEELPPLPSFPPPEKDETTTTTKKILKNNKKNNKKITEDDDSEAQRLRAFVAAHLTVICPHLPQRLSPAEAARRYRRHFYPVARFAAEKGLPVVPVDHPRSLARSRLLRDLLDDSGTAPFPPQQRRERQQRQERARRRRRESRIGRAQAFLQRCRDLAGVTDTAKKNKKKNKKNKNNNNCSDDQQKEDGDSSWSRHGRPLKDFDLAVVVSFRYFIPARLLEALPPTVNMHPSLLPLYRGASPIFSTLLRNEPVGGASVIQLRADQKAMDSGNVVWQCEVPIPPEMDIRTYLPLVTQLGAAGLCDTIFGEQRKRNPMWRQRQQQHTATSATHSADGLKMEGDWQKQLEKRVTDTLQNALPPPFITPEVISAALRAHHNYLLYCEHCALTGTVPSSPSAHQREIRCADAFPRSVRNSYCDWPDSFWYHWRTAPEQQYETFAHFSQDPFHAPLLPRDAAVLKFSEFTGQEAYGRWRAFVGGQYFQPAVNATLDKSCTPVRNQLAKRTLRRLVREKLKKLEKAQASGQPQSQGANTQLSAAAGNTNDEAEGARARASEGAGATPSQQRPQTNSTPLAAAKQKGRSPVRTEQKKQAAGKAKDPSTQAPPERKQQQGGKRKKTQKAAPIDLDAAASIIDTAMLQEVEEDLRLSCSFTKALPLDLVPAAVLEEMEMVELGPSVGIAQQQQQQQQQPLLFNGKLLEARFFRQPRPIFSSAQMTEKVKAAEEARRQRRRTDCLARRAEQRLAKDMDMDGKRNASSRSMTALADTMRQSFAAVLPTVMVSRTMLSRFANATVAKEQRRLSTEVDELEGDEVEEEGEDEETARKECALVLLETPELRMALAGEEEDGVADAGLDEEAPLEYVPDVIPIAPPAAATMLPWLADLGEKVGNDFLESERVEEAEKAAIVAAARRAEKEAEAIRRRKTATSISRRSASADTARKGKRINLQRPERGRQIPAFHIPTGTAYFPVSDEHIGAIKCKEGWFFWQEAHLKYATRAQPVVLLRKGMAMKTGILYAGLFSEYCK